MCIALHHHDLTFMTMSRLHNTLLRPTSDPFPRPLSKTPIVTCTVESRTSSSLLAQLSLVALHLLVLILHTNPPNAITNCSIETTNIIQLPTLYNHQHYTTTNITPPPATKMWPSWTHHYTKSPPPVISSYAPPPKKASFR